MPPTQELRVTRGLQDKGERSGKNVPTDHKGHEIQREKYLVKYHDTYVSHRRKKVRSPLALATKRNINLRGGGGVILK